jgi:hypothetical protein
MEMGVFINDGTIFIMKSMKLIFNDFPKNRAILYGQFQ